MDVVDELEQGISNLQEFGWCAGTLSNSDSERCLVGAITGDYLTTPALNFLADYIRDSQCPSCEAYRKRVIQIYEENGWGTPGFGDPVEAVYRHNDMCLQSGEDAILLLKKAIGEAENA